MKSITKVFTCAFLAFITVFSAFSFAGCSQQSVAEITYNYGDKNIKASLSESESNELSDIFSGKTVYSDNPSCGFSENVSVKISGKVYMPACDGCEIIKVGLGFEYFNISDAERDSLDEIFAKYGAIFPCV